MSWKSVCQTMDITPGGMKEFDVAGVAVLIVNSNGAFFAIPPNCPHMEEPLRTGICDGRILTCIKHLWQWDLDTAEPVGLAEVPLQKYQLREVDGRIEIFLEEELLYTYEDS